MIFILINLSTSLYSNKPPEGKMSLIQILAKLYSVEAYKRY